MSDNDPTGIWQDWRKASDERDEARQLAVDFRYRFEEAQKRNAELESQNEALQEKYNDLSERLVLSITRENAVTDFLGIA